MAENSYERYERKKKEREKQTLFIALTTLLIMGALVCYVLLK
jgi:hypothetical protein